MPDAHSIPFRQASGNGHYESKQLPDDNADFLVVLGLPTSVGNVTSASVSTLDGQVAAYWGTSGAVIKASTLIGVATLTDGVLGTKPNPAGDIVGTTAVQTLTNKTLVTPVITGSITGIDKSSVGLGNVDNTSDANKPVSGPQQTALNLKQDLAPKGLANGYAGLDATGKVPTSQLPAQALGGITYKGPWNALSNNPAIPLASASNQGWYYVVSVAGVTMVDGNNEWAINDWIVSNGTTWNKSDNTDAVTSVAGRLGAVVLTKSDVGLDQVDNTSDATKNSATVTLTNKTISGNSNSLLVRLNSDVVGNLPPSNLDGGSNASGSSFWRGDGHWGTPAGGGDVQSPGSSVDGEIALYNGVSGTILKRSAGTGIANVTNGVWQTPITVATLTPRLPRNYLSGLTLANNVTDATNDFNISAGECRDDTNSADIVLATPFVKQLDAAWVAGSGVGGRDTGAIANWAYHVFAIRNPATGICDVLVSQNATTPTMPSGYTQKRRIGSILRKAGAIIQFTQRGDYFQYFTPPIDVNAAVQTPGQYGPVGLASIPSGLKFQTHLLTRVSGSTAGIFVVEIRDPDTNYNTLGTHIATGGFPLEQIITLWTAADTTIYLFASGIPASTAVTYYIAVMGYWDQRGKQD